MRNHPCVTSFVLTLGLGGCSFGGSSGGSTELKDVEIVNKSTASGATVTEVVVPLSAGGYTEAPHVVTDAGRSCNAFAMGSRFPDGSLRYLRLEIPVEVTANERRTVEIQRSGEEPQPFEVHPAISGTIGVETRFRVGSKAFPFPEPELIESGPATRVYRSRVRTDNSMLWAELTVSVYSGLPHAKFTLQWGNSDPSNPELIEDPGQVELQVRGATVEYEKQGKILWQGPDGDFDIGVLHFSGIIGDGQSQLVEGRFVYGGADSPPRVFALAHDWGSAGTYGPFGVLLEDVAVDPVDFALRVQQEEQKHLDHPWARCVHGCNPDPGSTGNQDDFGTIMMRADLVLADPSRLQTITRSVYQEACRPTHHREMDVSPVTAANHPDLLTLEGRPKTTPDNKDTLGKKRDWLPGTARGPSGERWDGHDPEHLSINYLAGLALLTGNRFAREQVDHHCELYLTEFTHDTGFYNDGPGAARQVGRSSLAAIWMWQITGRDDVRQRVVDRTDDVLKLLRTYTQVNYNLLVIAPRGTYWVPWEEGMGVTGLAAVHRNFGSNSAVEVIHEVARTIIVNGFGHAEGEWRCGYKIPFKLPNGADYVPDLDPDFPTLAAGGGLTTWCIPALFIAAESHPDGGLRATALRIIKERYSQPMHGLDTNLDWICISPRATTLAGITSSY